MATRRNREIQEAIQAAGVVLEHLEAAADQLDRAKNWGVVDMLGGGFFTTMLKHNRMGDAEDELEEARDALRAFAHELADVEGVEGIDLDTGGFLEFADYFFDGIIADWLVQARIERARDEVDEAIRRVRRVRDRLCRL